MKVLLMRHGIAAQINELPAGSRSDDLRPLTQTGKERVTQCAAFYQKAFPEAAVILHSPLLRAIQTAELVAAKFPYIERLESTFLRPSTHPEDFLPIASSLRLPDNFIIVSHEPFLSNLAAFWTTGLNDSFTIFKESGALLLEAQEFEPRRAMISWMMAPDLITV